MAENEMETEMKAAEEKYVTKEFTMPASAYNTTYQANPKQYK